jgi:protein-disulfide isomerase
MTNDADGSKKARRDTAREQAKLEREAAKRRKKRNKLLIQGGVILAVVVVAAIVAVSIATGGGSSTAANPKNMASDGILFTAVDDVATPVTTKSIPSGDEPTGTDLADYADTVNIVTYVDYACPICQTFEQTNAEQIEQLVAAGEATLEIHPIAILDRMSLGTRYSSRAANAAACVANFEPEKYLDVSEALYANQPEENTSGLDTAELKQVVSDAGATSDDVASCISDKSFLDWTENATERSGTGPLPNTDVAAVTGTPTVLANGVQYTGAIDDADAFLQFLSSVAAS